MDHYLPFYQTLPFHIDPIIATIGSVEIRYYGIMYMMSFVVVYGLCHWRINYEESPLTNTLLEKYFTWAILAAVIGARIGYVYLYNLGYFLQNPGEMFFPFEVNSEGWRFVGISGLSYHGGLFGVVLATFFFCQRYQLKLWKVADFIIAAAPLGYTFGRIGNFLNRELYGRLTNAWWGMRFPTAPGYGLRHPSQLYEAFFEGIVLFIILWACRKKTKFDGQLFCMYLMGYGLVRFFIEFVREPDAHIGLLGGLSLGQILCLIMMLASIGLFSWLKRQHSR